MDDASTSKHLDHPKPPPFEGKFMNLWGKDNEVHYIRPTTNERLDGRGTRKRGKARKGGKKRASSRKRTGRKGVVEVVRSCINVSPTEMKCEMYVCMEDRRREEKNEKRRRESRVYGSPTGEFCWMYIERGPSFQS